MPSMRTHDLVEPLCTVGPQGPGVLDASDAPGGDLIPAGDSRLLRPDRGMKKAGPTAGPASRSRGELGPRRPPSLSPVCVEPSSRERSRGDFAAELWCGRGGLVASREVGLHAAQPVLRRTEHLGVDDENEPASGNVTDWL